MGLPEPTGGDDHRERELADLERRNERGELSAMEYLREKGKLEGTFADRPALFAGSAGATRGIERPTALPGTEPIRDTNGESTGRAVNDSDDNPYGTFIGIGLALLLVGDLHGRVHPRRRANRLRRRARYVTDLWPVPRHVLHDHRRHHRRRSIGPAIARSDKGLGVRRCRWSLRARGRRLAVAQSKCDAESRPQIVPSVRHCRYGDRLRRQHRPARSGLQIPVAFTRPCPQASSTGQSVTRASRL